MKSNEEYWKTFWNEKAVKFNDHSKLIHTSKNAIGNINKVFYRIISHYSKRKIRVLDVGCGPGEYCRIMYNLGFNVTGVDYSKNMIKTAIKKSKGTKIRYKVGDIYHLPFKDTSFDLVICMDVIQNTLDGKKAIKELKRVVRANGNLILTTLNKNSINALYYNLAEKLKSMLYSNNEIDHWFLERYNPFKFKKMLENAGFSNISISGVYIFPKSLRKFEKLFNKFKIYKLMDKYFFVGCLFSHHFTIEAKA